MRAWSFTPTLLLAACAGGLGNEGDDSAGLGDTTAAATGTTHSGASDAADGTSAQTSSTTEGTTEGTTDPAGTTTEDVPDCAMAWRTARTDGTLADVALDADTGTVYAVGHLPSGEGWAMALDACDGSVLADTTVEHASATSTTLSGVALTGGAVFVVGAAVLPTDPRNGLYGRLDALDLTTVWTAPLFGSATQDELLDIAVSADGELWMSGTSRYDDMATAWVVRGTAAADGACGFGWNGLGSGSARAIARDGDALVIAVRTTEGAMVLARYDQACTCMCQPSWSSDPIMVGDLDTSVGELLVVGGQYYVAGWGTHAAAPGDLFAHVTWVSSMGVVIETYTTNLTADDDGFFFVGADDELLYLGGGEGWMGEAGFLDTTAVLQALELPLGAGAQPVWDARPAEVDTINAVGIEPEAGGYLYVGGNIDADGVVLRCDKQGDCG